MDSHWAWLPPHLLDSVLEKIEVLMDFFQFSDVCASWNSVTKTNHSHYIKILSQQAPMLLMPSEESNSHSVYDAITNSFLKSKLVAPFDKRFAGSSLGWLVVVEKDFGVTLYKPYFKVEGENNTTNDTIINLPSVFPSDNQEDYADVFEDYVYRATITADPLTNPDQYTVMVIFSDLRKLAFIRPAKHTTWTYVDSIPCVDDILYCNDNFYALTMEGELYSFRISDSSILDFKLVASKPPLPVVGKSYLVESYEKKLLRIVRYMHWKYASDEDETISGDDDKIVGRSTTLVKVYELDRDKGKWIVINSLGDLALFLGDNSSISILTSNFLGYKPNNIYFTHDKDLVDSDHTCINDIGTYDLETRRMELHFGGATSCAKRRFPIWIAPKLH